MIDEIDALETGGAGRELLYYRSGYLAVKIFLAWRWDRAFLLHGISLLVYLHLHLFEIPGRLLLGCHLPPVRLLKSESKSKSESESESELHQYPPVVMKHQVVHFA